jgi:hypothetical protein
MNYSAVANHSVNQTVHVDSHTPVVSLNEAEEQKLHVGRYSGMFGDLRVRRDTDNTRTPHGTSLTEHGTTTWRGPRDRT